MTFADHTPCKVVMASPTPVDRDHDGVNRGLARALHPGMVTITRNRLVSPLLAALMSAAPCALASGATADYSQANALVQNLVTTVPLAGAGLVVAGDGGILHEAWFGNYTANTRVPVASASKWVSAIAIARLVDDGLLAWDTTVGSLMPEAPADKHPITLRQLFSHTSGLAGGEGGCLGDQTTTLAACAATILAAPLARAPGTCFSYGGGSMQVAGRLAELATGQTWDALFVQRVATPLGLVATDYAFNSTAPGYVAVPNPRIAGGVRSTARDMARLAQLFAADGAFAGTQLLAPATVAYMMADQTDGAPYASNPDPTSFGYGIGLWRNRVDASAVAREVASPGAFGTWPWFDRDTGVGGVLLVRNVLGNVEPTARRLTAAVRTAAGDGGPLFDAGFEGASMRSGCGLP
jgi:CubicO group peptidase (beta-lactamase class C family)